MNPKSLQNLKSWSPGQSGNPKGKPPGKHSTTILEQILKTKVEVNVPDLKKENKQTVRRLTIKEAMLWKLSRKALDGSLASMVEVLDRTEGSVPQEIYGELGVTKKEQFDLNDEHTRELLKQLYIRQQELSGTGKD